MLVRLQSDVGVPFRSLGQGSTRKNILNRAVTDQSQSNITSLHIYSCFSRTEFICKISPANAESGIKQGLGFLGLSAHA